MSILDNAEHWRARAAEARALANLLDAPVAKRNMFAVAESYEEIAKHAEERAIANARH